MFAMNISEPGWLADMIATSLSLNFEARQELLTLLDPRGRLQAINKILAQELDVLELQDEIHSRVRNEVDKTQREYYLREQMRQIQNELGEGDVFSRDAAELKRRITAANLPDEPKAVALKELERLNQMPPMAPEIGTIRSYIEWILDLPWTNCHARQPGSTARRQGPGARSLRLEEGQGTHPGVHRGAVAETQEGTAADPVLCRVRPAPARRRWGARSPRRSDASSCAFRWAAYATRPRSADTAGRTSVPCPGRVLQTMKRAGTINPLFMLDEIDKLYSDFRGDPASAMLEVLDPEQNYAFSDHYLEMPYDLSKVMFVTTANYLGPIPPALLDRMEVIEFPGYIEDEKLEIATRFLIPRQIEENGVSELGLHVRDRRAEADHPRVHLRGRCSQSGTRDRPDHPQGGAAEGRGAEVPAGHRARTRSRSSSIRRNTSRRRWRKADEVGVVQSLAWTENGGEIMSVEVAVLEGKGSLQMTGQLGEVMQESAQAGLTYIKSRAGALGIDLDVFERMDIHLHIPEGAIPERRALGRHHDCDRDDLGADGAAGHYGPSD